MRRRASERRAGGSTSAAKSKAFVAVTMFRDLEGRVTLVGRLRRSGRRHIHTPLAAGRSSTAGADDRGRRDAPEYRLYVLANK